MITLTVEEILCWVAGFCTMILIFFGVMIFCMYVEELIFGEQEEPPEYW